MSPGFTADSRLGDALDSPEGAAILQRYVPNVVSEPWLLALRYIPLGEVLTTWGGSLLDADRLERCWTELAALNAPPPSPRVDADPIKPREDYEPESVPGGSATFSYPERTERWDIFELVLDGPSHGNPFVDVEVRATFTSVDHHVRIGGFYDGQGRYLVRFMPPWEGEWSFLTDSTARSLDGVSGAFVATPPRANNHGPVSVTDTYHFSYADGSRHLPLGTTAYAWTSQPEALQEQTLKTLASAPFTKLRMCLFPKSFMLNSNEPDTFVFPRTEDAQFDTTRFDLNYFRALDKRIRELRGLGIEADLILFHPYDRWGFADLGRAADDRYVRYVVRRLSAFRNVWWSMANEHDLIRSKSVTDWERLGSIVTSEDAVGHPASIHNWVKMYDHSRPWVTHCSIQSNAVESIATWRDTWAKPVLIDECGYEGDLDQGWGNITGPELTRLFWEGAVRGAYAGHGETYLNDREELWWAKGGSLVGDCPERVRFLRSIIEASPSGVLEPLRSDWDLPWAGIADRYMVGYFGIRQPRYRDVVRAPGVGYHVDVIDTWNMTISRVPGTFEGSFRVELPTRQYMAIRLIAAD